MILLLSLLLSCDEPPEHEWRPVEAGVPVAGAAEGALELPIGVPLGCYTARCKVLGRMSWQDRRQGPYNVGFDESTGIHTRPMIKSIWLENGNDHLVMIKWDACMSSDALVGAITERLETATGQQLDGRVVLSASHTHSGYGSYLDQWHWYLGTDGYNEEIFQRTADQMAEVALEAWESREPAQIGLGWDFDWDPNNKVYSDRRGDNNDLVVWDDQEDWVSGKDPHLAVLRVDSTAGDPIAMAYIFGMHGIIMDADNPMVSTDSIGGLEMELQEDFDEPVVVMHIQGAGGDASPRGRDHNYARMETIGAYGHEAIHDLWSRTPTAADAITMETASRHIWQEHQQIKVTRNGTVDWYYSEPIDLNTGSPDNAIYDDNGDIISPIDEFNAPNGAAFCGSDAPLIPGYGVGADVYPYDACVDVEPVGLIVAITFGFDAETDISLPFRESYKAGTTATRFGPIPVLTDSGEVVQRDFAAGIFPGEPVAMFAEQWRRRAEAELGWEHPLTIGYSQDHEGYLMIPEDWLRGGYEPNINLWGPLQGEHIMEGVLDYASLLNTDVHEDPDPSGYYAAPDYPVHDLPTTHPTDVTEDGAAVVLFPDPTPDAGTRVHEPFEGFWVPDDFGGAWTAEEYEGFIDIAPLPEQIERVSGQIQIAWRGGDPMVDPPYIFLEHEGVGGWERVKTHSGRLVTEAMSDILVGYTPDPLFPHSALQTHTYWAAWQAVGHVHDRAGIPLGNYRLVVEGQHYVGDSETWPWASEPYTVTTESFEVVPATVHVESDTDGLWAWMQAPASGYRFVDLEGDSRGRNPVRGTVSVELDDGTDGPPVPVEVEVTEVVDGRAKLPVDLTGYIGATVRDGYGNQGYSAL